MRTCDSNTATMRRVWRHISGYFLLAAALLLSGTSFAAGPRQPEERVVNLMGPWKFQIGDNNAWAAPGFDDREWDKIYAPACWEDEGFAGYDGYAWYRRHFTLDEGQETGMLYLHLGEIDDVDEVYLNGRRIGGSGAFPPRFYTAYSVYRIYPLPEEYLNAGGNNVLAVRVYDSHREGGIVHGRIGIYAARPALAPDISLGTVWKFRTGDDPQWKDPRLDEQSWQDITVPGFWESQGLGDYDGFGWYRRHFRLPADLRDSELVLVLGRIDDFDEVFINGQRIGGTGRINQPSERIWLEDEYLQLREYAIPAAALNRDGDNVLAVRVYDGMIDGGIYDGPVGIYRQERMPELRRKVRSWSHPHEHKRFSLYDLFFN